MNDRPGADNLRNMDQAPQKITHTPLSNMEAPGRMTHSTPLNRERMIADLQNPGRSKEDDLMMKALMDNLKADNSPGQEMPNPSNLIEKKIMIDQPIEQPKIKKNSPKKDISQQKGFLMPFVNGFNNIIDGIWNTLKSLVPMKPQTGGGTA